MGFLGATAAWGMRDVENHFQRERFGGSGLLCLRKGSASE